ncbi:MAG: protein kinase [Planctomycetes bacterium]|nr:protein kinase [Planctomycetota bacterium]
MAWIREANAEPIPGYRLIEPLGSGGFGEVWKCEAPGGWIKAIKFVYGNRNAVDNDSIRADQEFKALQRVKEVRHPFVCSVEQTLEIDGELIIVMEYADCTLHDKHEECKNAGLIGIPGEDLMRYLRDAAEALDFMYEKHNLQHLDVKPRNLFLIGDHVKVADFGLVKTADKSNSSGILGGVTPLYASPETFVGKISPQSDQYSLAIVYQELLTGHRPFVAKNIRQMAQMHLQAEPDLRSLPEIERAVVARALSKDPAKRFPKCIDFMKAIHKARSSARIVEMRPIAGSAGLGRKSKTLADTMEDILLEDSQPQQPANGVQHQLAAIAVAEADEVSPEVEVSDLGVTVAQPDTGSLRPTLIIGVGTFGRKAIMELRCRFLDRFGDLNKLPLLHFLYLDTDKEAGEVACMGAPQVALSRNDIYHLPLQPVVNYRRRSLDQLAEWLPRDKLYAMPRSLQTQGSRALGRLAFADNQQRLIARLRREIQEISHPDTVYKSVENTGLALINSTPRIYVLGAAGGGSSGMLPDLGYALRRLLVNLRQPEGKVVGLFMCGAANDPATPKTELANVYATLTELNHFSDPSIPFAAEYGSEGQRIVDQGSPYHSVYLMPLAHRSPDALDETVAHLGSYLFHELTTPLGLRLEQMRHEDELGESGPAMGQLSVPLRAFGTYAVWFPRGLLLNLAGRHACRRLVEQWVATDTMASSSEIQAAIQATVKRCSGHAELTPAALANAISSTAQAGAAGEVGAAPGEVLSSMLAKMEDQLLQSTAQDDPGNWGKQAMSRIRDWMGAGSDDQDYSEWRKTKLARSLSIAAQKTAEHWDQRIMKDAYDLMAFPGARVAGAEIAMGALHAHFKKAAEAQTAVCLQYAPQSAQAWRDVEVALQECIKGSGGFRLFSGRSKTRLLRAFFDKLSHYAHLRLTEELAGGARQCMIQLAAKLADRLRDLGFCRQRLRHLQENLDHPAVEDEDLNGTRAGAGERTMGRSPLPTAESFWDNIRQSDTARVVLPDGHDDLEQAALRFLQDLKPEQWLQLDRELHEKVLEPQGGLHGACMNGDLTRQMAVPLLEGTTQFMNQHLPIMDVAQIIKREVESGESVLSEAAGDSLREQTQDYLERSMAPWVNKHGHKRHEFLLIPASTAGKGLSESIMERFPDLKLVRVPGQSDLMFLCEQGGLAFEELKPLLKPCRAAYEAAVGSPVTSTHARFDVVDWLPLEP